jgi:hypothetical protein
MTAYIIAEVTPSTRRTLQKKRSQTLFLNQGIKTLRSRFYDMKTLEKKFFIRSMQKKRLKRYF